MIALEDILEDIPNEFLIRVDWNPKGEIIVDWQEFAKVDGFTYTGIHCLCIDEKAGTWTSYTSTNVDDDGQGDDSELSGALTDADREALDECIADWVTV
jgi:hypothetical protein